MRVRPEIKNPLPAIEDEGSATLALSSKTLCLPGLAGVSTSTHKGRLLRHHRASPSAALDKAQTIVPTQLAEVAAGVNQQTTRSTAEYIYSRPTWDDQHHRPQDTLSASARQDVAGIACRRFSDCRPI